MGVGNSTAGSRQALLMFSCLPDGQKQTDVVTCGHTSLRAATDPCNAVMHRDPTDPCNACNHCDPTDAFQCP